MDRRSQKTGPVICFGVPLKACAYIFDVFGTVVDWRTGVAREAARFFDDKKIDLNPLEFADRWRGKYQPAMQRIRSGGRGYIALDTLHRENLDELLEEYDLDSRFDEMEKSALNQAWEKLPPWPDSIEGLEYVKKNAIIAPCSNGSIALMTRIAKFGGLPWDCILGAEIARNYKPEPEVYLASVNALGLKPEQVCMVAAHNNDLEAAAKCGLQTAFIARRTEYGEQQKDDLEPSGDWDQVIDTIALLS